MPLQTLRAHAEPDDAAIQADAGGLKVGVLLASAALHDARATASLLLRFAASRYRVADKRLLAA
jgi:hypothetical protein